MAKIGFLGQKPKFWAKKKGVTFGDSPCSGHDRKKLFKEKKCLCPNNQIQFNSKDYSISFFSGIFNSKKYSIIFFPGKFNSKIDSKI